MSLPFDEAERNWLLSGVYEFVDNWQISLDTKRPAQQVGRQTDKLLSAGQYQEVRGRDLLDRWWSWRRETGEYADGAGLNQARESLKGLIELISPELDLPESYTALQRLPNPEAQSPESR
jgi:hypothetical protein